MVLNLCFAGDVLPISSVLTSCNGCVLCAMRGPQRGVSQFDWLFFFSNFAVSISDQPLIVIDLSHMPILARCLITVRSLINAMNWTWCIRNEIRPFERGCTRKATEISVFLSERERGTNDNGPKDPKESYP